MSGNTTATTNTELEKEIISRFKQVQESSVEEKKTVLSLLAAHIVKARIKEMLGAKIRPLN